MCRYCSIEGDKELETCLTRKIQENDMFLIYVSVKTRYYFCVVLKATQTQETQKP